MPDGQTRAGIGTMDYHKIQVLKRIYGSGSGMWSAR